MGGSKSSIHLARKKVQGQDLSDQSAELLPFAVLARRRPPHPALDQRLGKLESMDQR